MPAVAERSRLVVEIERQADSDAGTVGPRWRREVAASPRPADDLTKLGLAERPWRRRVLRWRLLACNGERDDEGGGQLDGEEVETEFHRAHSTATRGDSR